MPESYVLRAFTAADLPMMAQWLAAPHLRQWWGDPAEEMALLSEDLDNPLMDQHIGMLANRGRADGGWADGAFAYLQSYPCHAWGPPQFKDRPDGSRSVDMCIGPAEMLGLGHGNAILRLYAKTLRMRGATDIVIDPDPSNERAVRCYRRAGFRDVAICEGEDGDPVLVMEFNPAPTFSS